jgi:hypothetical protein
MFNNKFKMFFDIKMTPSVISPCEGEILPSENPFPSQGKVRIGSLQMPKNFISIEIFKNPLSSYNS